MAFKTIKTIALFTFSLAAMPVQAFPILPLQEQPLALSINIDCAQSAEQVIAQTGGELLSATPTIHNGQSVCKITVLVKSSSGQRPKKLSVTVPQ